jgi:CheY-like chemotaxis protein
VDDEPVILKMIAAVLTDLGYDATAIAADAETALDLAQLRKPDIVITDVRLPGMDGAELARRIKACAEMATTPVILMSAYREPSPNPGDAFLQKPFDVEQLALTVRRHIGDRR